MAWKFFNSSGQEIVSTAAGPSQATQSAIEAETNEDTYVPPDLIKNSPGVAKVWCKISAAGALQTGDYNVASVTDSGTGDRTIVFDTDFADTNYVPLSHAYASTTLNIHPEHPTSSFATGSVDLNMYETESNTADDRESTTVIFGDQ